MHYSGRGGYRIRKRGGPNSGGKCLEGTECARLRARDFFEK